MTWEIRAGYSGSARWAKWVDLEAASRWCVVLESLVNATDTAALVGPVYPAWLLELNRRTGRDEAAEIRLHGAVVMDAAWVTERRTRQIARLVELATALRGFALACDMDVFALGPYAARRIAGDDGGRDYPGLYGEGTDRTDFVGSWRAAAFLRLRAAVPVIGAASDLRLDLYPRVDFSAEGTVAVRTDVIDPDSGRDDGADILGAAGDPAWDPWSGWVVKWWAPPAGAAASTVEVTALCPLSFSWDVLHGAARTIVAARINRTLALSAGYVGARNARLSKVLGGEGLPETVVQYSAALNVAHLATGLPPEVEALCGVITGIATAAGAVPGLVVGLFVGLAGIIARLLPRATAYATDCWGRSGPSAVGAGASPFGPFLQPISASGTLAPPVEPVRPLVPLPDRFARLAVDPRWAEGVLGAPEVEAPPVEGPPVEDSSGGGGGGGLLLLGGLALLRLLAGG